MRKYIFYIFAILTTVFVGFIYVRAQTIYPIGPVRVVHPNGSWTTYSATTSFAVETARGTALQTALGRAIDGDSIYLSPGTYDIGTTGIDLSKGGTMHINLYGSGKYTTIIQSARTAGGGIIITPGTGSVTSDLSIVGTAAVGSYQAGWGSLLRYFTNATLENVYINVDTDGIYIDTFVATPATSTVKNVNIVTGYDGIATFTSTSSVLNVYDSSITAVANQNPASPSAGNYARGVVSNAGTINLYNTEIYAARGALNTYGVYTSAGATPAAALNVYGGKIRTSGPNSVTFDLAAQGGTSVGVTANTNYTAASTTGTITYIDNPTGRYSIGSSGASSTILTTNGTYSYWTSTSTLISAFSLSGGSNNTLTYWTSGSTIAATSSPTVGYITATTTTATSTLSGGFIAGNNAIVEDVNSGTTTISNLNFGAMSFDVDAGTVNLIDLPISAAAANTPESYTANINTMPLMTWFGQAYGSSNVGVKNAGVGIGSTSPIALMAIQNNGNSALASSTYSLYIASTTANFSTTTHLVVANTGNVGLGTTSPYSMLSVAGQVVAQNYVATSSTATSTFNGPVGIGTTTPAAKIGLNGQSYWAGLTTSASAQTNNLCLSASNEVIADSASCLPSALKFKKDIQPIDLGLDIVLRLRPVNYFLKNPTDINNTTKQFGFIADEAAEIDSRLATYDEKGEVHGFRYEQYTAVLTKAVQEQQAQIASQQKQLLELKAEIEKLKKK